MALQSLRTVIEAPLPVPGRGKKDMHYVAMMAIAAVISIAGMRSADDFRRAFDAVTAGDMTGAAGYTVLGVRRALQDADNHQLPQHLRQVAEIGTSSR